MENMENMEREGKRKYRISKSTEFYLGAIEAHNAACNAMFEALESYYGDGNIGPSGERYFEIMDKAKDIISKELYQCIEGNLQLNNNKEI